MDRESSTGSVSTATQRMAINVARRILTQSVALSAHPAKESTLVGLIPSAQDLARGVDYEPVHVQLQLVLQQLSAAQAISEMADQLSQPGFSDVASAMVFKLVHTVSPEVIREALNSNSADFSPQLAETVEVMLRHNAVQAPGYRQH
jgi:hypothetical protein